MYDDYEGDFIRLSTGEVFLVKNHELIYQNYLTKEQWATVVDVGYSTKKGFLDVMGDLVKSAVGGKKAQEKLVSKYATSQGIKDIQSAGKVAKGIVITGAVTAATLGIGTVIAGTAAAGGGGLLAKMGSKVGIASAKNAADAVTDAQKAKDVMKFNANDYGDDAGNVSFPDDPVGQGVVDEALSSGTSLLDKAKALLDKNGLGGLLSGSSSGSGSSSSGSNPGNVVQAGTDPNVGMMLIAGCVLLAFMLVGGAKK
jgi:hypothetical protein